MDAVPFTSSVRGLSALLARLLLVLLLVTGCSEPPPPLKVATNIWPGYEPLYLARDMGYYESPIQLLELASASSVLEALRNGSVQAGALTLDETLKLVQDDIPLRVILVMDFSAGGDVLLAKPEFSRLEDLRGRNVAVEYTAVGAILLDGALTAAGMTIDDINLVPCELSRHQTCYQENDAVVTFEPVRSLLLKQGARQLFDSSQIPNRIVDVLVIREDALPLHETQVRDLLAGYFKARQLMDTRPEEAHARIGDRIHLTPREVAESYEGLQLPDLATNHQLLSPPHPEINSIATALTRIMYKRQLLQRELPAPHLADDSFLPPMP